MDALTFDDSFDLELGDAAAGPVKALRFDLSEALSQPFSAFVDFASPDSSPWAPETVLGQPAVLRLRQTAEPERVVRAVVAAFEKTGIDPLHQTAFYRVTLRPRLWKASLGQDIRFFDERTTPEIVDEVLSSHGIEVDWRLGPTPVARPYSVQYRESDLQFVSRLLEEEGFFYFFEHPAEGETETLVISDGSRVADPVDGLTFLPFRNTDSGNDHGAHVREAVARREMGPDGVALRDYNPIMPDVDMQVVASDRDDVRDALETYDYPGHYEQPESGKLRANVRWEESRARVERVVGRALDINLLPGRSFVINGHPVAGIDDQYLVIAVHHAGHQGNRDAGDTMGPGQGSAVLSASFTAQPSAIRFRPPRQTPWPVIAGFLSATVVGPEGEEIFTDGLGRIRVQFPWDRLRDADEKASCWIRVAQAWAGVGWGALFLPRIGQEVLVAFENGDPDRPLVIGSAYNGTHPTPETLPDQKTRSTLRSASSPGSSGFNEIAFEDAKGQELFYVHAERDMEIVVERDRSLKVKNDETTHVTGNRSRTVGGNQMLEVHGNDTSTIDGYQVLHVVGNRDVTVDKNMTETVLGHAQVNVGPALIENIGGTATETIGAGKLLAVTGDTTLHVNGNLEETVTGDKLDTVGGNLNQTVGGNVDEKVGGDFSRRVLGEFLESFEKSAKLRVGKSQTTTVKETLEQAVKGTHTLKTKELVIEASDKFTLKVGDASFTMDKAGNVVLSGKKMELVAKGELLIKGSTIGEQ